MEGKNHVNQLAKSFGQEIENAGWIRYDRGIEFSILLFNFLAKKKEKKKKIKVLIAQISRTDYFSSIFFTSSPAIFGISIRSTPFLNVASTLSLSTSVGSGIDR